MTISLKGKGEKKMKTIIGNRGSMILNDFDFLPFIIATKESEDTFEIWIKSKTMESSLLIHEVDKTSKKYISRIINKANTLLLKQDGFNLVNMFNKEAYEDSLKSNKVKSQLKKNMARSEEIPKQKKKSEQLRIDNSKEESNSSMKVTVDEKADNGTVSLTPIIDCLDEE